MITKELSKEFLVKLDALMRGTEPQPIDAEGEIPDEALIYQSLKEVFENIEEIVPAYAEKHLGLFRLPNDEPMFEVDLNSRQIKVPTEFAKNGVAVVGDHLAETLWFKVDRYFDVWDLAGKDMKAMIEWKTPSGEIGISDIYLTDIDAEQNFIILGWPISSALTKVKGKIQFDLKFIQEGDAVDPASGEAILDYSIATIPASVEVKETLNYKEAGDDSLVSNADLYAKRFVNSPAVGGEAIKADVPEFIEKYVDKEEKDLKDGVLKLDAQVYKTNGFVKYFWLDKEGNALDAEMKFVDADLEFNAKKLYYVKDANSTGFIPCNDLEAFEDDKEYFERVSHIEINKTGKYMVKAQNKAGSSIEYGYNPPLVDSMYGYFEVPGPKELVLPKEGGLVVKEAIEIPSGNKLQVKEIQLSKVEGAHVGDDKDKLVLDWFKMNGSKKEEAKEAKNGIVTVKNPRLEVLDVAETFKVGDVEGCVFKDNAIVTPNGLILSDNAVLDGEKIYFENGNRDKFSETYVLQMHAERNGDATASVESEKVVVEFPMEDFLVARPNVTIEGLDDDDNFEVIAVKEEDTIINRIINLTAEMPELAIIQNVKIEFVCEGIGESNIEGEFVKGKAAINIPANVVENSLEGPAKLTVIAKVGEKTSKAVVKNFNIKM